MRKTGDLFVLLGDAFLGVDHDQTDICTFNCHLGAEYGELFKTVLDLRLTADARGVDEDELAVLVFKLGIDGIARRASHIGDDTAFLTGQTVDDGRLADVGLADDGDLDIILIALDLLVGRGKLQHAVEQITGACAVQRRQRNQVFVKAELVELVEFHRKIADGVDLVDERNDRLAGALEHHGDVDVLGSKTALAVNHEQDDICHIDGDLRLRLHLGQKHIVGFRLDTAGIDDGQRTAVPLDFVYDAVTGHAGDILDDGHACTRQFIEQGALADVRTSDNRCHGFGHGVSSLL